MIAMDAAEAKRKRLREALESGSPTVAVGAHDALSAQLIEANGFNAVWVSGFGVSTMAFALPDLNLVTQTEMLEASVRIDRATSLPVVADCDNGFGGFSNVVRTATEFEGAGIAAVCVEDNTFPKRNSLFMGQVRRELIPIEEQARRIRAAKDAQSTESFVFIARVEALIAGHGVQAACDRADAYVEAGADALLIHSRDETLAEIAAFLDSWRGKGSVPLVAVPTAYPSFSVEELWERGFQMIIFANHPMRAAVGAMERVLERLKRDRRASSADREISTVDHLFDLVKMREAIDREESPAS